MTLDLKKMEENLGEVLNNETDESMSEWLEDKRKDQLLIKMKEDVKFRMIELQKGTTAEKHLPKELAKVDAATQFIGEGIGSTGKYKLAWGQLANTGKYTKDDVIMLAANGNRKGAFDPIVNNELQGEYKNIDKAIEVGATFVADTMKHLVKSSLYNKGEIKLAWYLYDKGYRRHDTDVIGIWKKE